MTVQDRRSAPSNWAEYLVSGDTSVIPPEEVASADILKEMWEPFAVVSAEEEMGSGLFGYPVRETEGGPITGDSRETTIRMYLLEGPDPQE